MAEEIGDAVVRRQVPILLGIIGVLLGILIGGAVMLLVWPAAPGVRTEPQTTSAPAVPPRWYIWEGSAPLVGVVFQTEDKCEIERKSLVDVATAAAERRLKSLPPMTMRELQALGNPADRIEEGLNKIYRAYCRVSP